jgi:signal transduction histidine kinase
VRLKTQFLLLITGIVLVPFLVVGTLFAMQALDADRQAPLPNYRQITSWLSGVKISAAARRELADFVNRRPEGVESIIIDRNFRIIHSTIPEFAEGNEIDEGALFKYISDNSTTAHFQFETPRALKSTGILILLKLTRINPRVDVWNKMVQYFIYLSLALFAFSVLGSSVILRSLNQSITTLEEATRRVAAGDLDSEVIVSGSGEIAELTRSFDHMRGALKEVYAKRARFVMGISHDLKTPIALIEGYVAAIIDGYADEPEVRKNYLEIIDEKAQSLDGMITDLIDFEKMETGEWKATHRDVDLFGFLEDIARRFTEDAALLHREFSSNIEIPTGTMVRMDERLAYRAFENIVGNALRYTPEEGRIAFEARKSDGFYVVSVSDTGIGIPETELDAIFDPFFRGTNSRREQGTGLGLATVKSIITSHGWTIDVRSTVNKGSIFSVRIPIKAKQ